MTRATGCGYSVPAAKRIRVIIDTDAKNEADDQFAIVHALLTPKFDVRGVIAAHFGEDKSTRSMLDSHEEITRIFRLMGDRDESLIFKGAERAIDDPDRLPASAGAGLIVSEAMKTDDHRLYCAFLGPLTDMAIAVLRRPEIRDRLTVVWIGGGAWPRGGWEYNLRNDIRAANIVFRSGLDLRQVPRDVYSRIRVGLAELRAKVRPCGKIGRYLFDQLLAVNDACANNPAWPAGESWCLGDSAAVGLLMDDHEFYHAVKEAPLFNDDMTYRHEPGSNRIRVYEDIDARFILEDFFAKLALFARRRF